MKQTTVAIASIELDESTQCRAEMRQEVIDDYSEAMGSGIEFPPVDVFGTSEKSWVGDGWHRILAARELGLERIHAVVHPGGRTEAVKFALNANAAHGLRRSNADKRRAVRVAMREFQGLSHRAVAELCGVGKTLVALMRMKDQEIAQLSAKDSSPDARIGLDGKRRPAHIPRIKAQRSGGPGAEPGAKPDNTKSVGREDSQPGGETNYRPSNGMEYAIQAISCLEKIQRDDTRRVEALDYVAAWIGERR